MRIAKIVWIFRLWNTHIAHTRLFENTKADQANWYWFPCVNSIDKIFAMNLKKKKNNNAYFFLNRNKLTVIWIEKRTYQNVVNSNLECDFIWF